MIEAATNSGTSVPIIQEDNVNASQSVGLLRSCLIYHNPWRKRSLRRFYASFIQPGDLCFDLGAHVGNRISVWLALGATVVALEPQSACMSLLQRWYGHHPRVTLLAEAVGAEPGQATLHVSQRHPTVTTLSQPWIERVSSDQSFASVTWDKSDTVPVTTLDALITRFGLPAFCKIDVEGMEVAVLRGLSQPIPHLSFEYHPATFDDAFACLTRLGQLGHYGYNWSVGESHLFASQSWLSAAEIKAGLPQIVANGRSGDLYARLVG